MAAAASPAAAGVLADLEFYSRKASHRLYDGPIECDFEKSEDGSLYMKISTERLVGHYVEESDVADYCNLFSGDFDTPERRVMRYYADRTNRLPEKTAERVRDSWMRRWQEEEDPFTAVPFRLKSTGEFVTHVIAGGSDGAVVGDARGASEMAYVTHPKFWEQGFTTEAVTALVRGYLPKICTYSVGDLPGERAPLRDLYVTVFPDNLGSYGVARDAGFSLRRRGMHPRYGERLFLHMSIDEILKRAAVGRAAG